MGFQKTNQTHSYDAEMLMDYWWWFCFLQLGIRRLVESGRYDTHENFTVVIQHFLQNPKISLGQVQSKEISACKGLSGHIQPIETI